MPISPDLLHRRQFLIGSEPVLYRPNWKCIQLSTACFLSYCPTLPVKSIEDSGGKMWILLGIAVQTDPARPDPDEEIRQASTRDVPLLYHSWAGRWMLIGDNEIHLDASGFLGCYYVREADSHASGIWASSSEALLTELLRERAGTKDHRKLSYRVGIEWFPPPRSRYSSISRLLLSQVLRLSDRSVRERRLYPDLENPSYEEVLERLETLLLTFLRRMPAGNRTTWITLTGGNDSRVIAAAISKAGLRARTFTQGYRAIPVANEEKSRSISLADRLLPPRLSQILGTEHSWISGKRFDRGKADLFDTHTCRNVVDIQRHFFARDQWRFVNGGDLILGGLCFEVGRCYFWRKLGDDPFPSVEAIARGYHEDPNSSLSQGMADWLRWVKQTPHPDLDWRDRFYIEQRLGGWQCAREQSMDLIPADLLHPMNSHYAHALSLSVPVEKRAKGQHQIDLVKRMAPQLLELPVNPNYDFFPRTTRFYYHWREDPWYPMKWLLQKYG